MGRDLRIAVLSLVPLLPALVLVSSGLLGLEPAGVLVHPLLVMGGLVTAFGMNAIRLLRVRIGQDEGALVSTVSVRLRGTALNLAALSLSCLLLATVTAYVLVENVRLR